MEFVCCNCKSSWEVDDDSSEKVRADLIDCPLCERSEEKEEEEVPEKKPVKKPQVKKPTHDIVHTPAKSIPRKYPNEMKEFIKEEIDNLTNDELVDQIKKRWSPDITKPRLAAYMQFNNIKRKPLKKLPPEDDSFFGPEE